MTHDELLEAIDAGVTNLPQDFQRYRWVIRAVVELHKPQDITLPNGEWGINCSHCNLWTFPCPTIQKIMDELK